MSKRPQLTSKTGAKRLPRYIHIPSFLTESEQRDLSYEAFRCHHHHSPHQHVCKFHYPHGDICFTTESKQRPPQTKEIKARNWVKRSVPDYSTKDCCCCHWEGMDASTSSRSLNLGLSHCGEDISPSLPVAVKLARRAFRMCSSSYLSVLGSEELANASGRLGGYVSDGDRDCAEKDCPILTGIALLYGPRGSMNPHHDSPTEPGKREEWLAMLTVGNDVHFRCDDEVLTLQSGDALVMDSMAVLHGVVGIGKSQRVNDDDDPAVRYGLPVHGSRLGVLLWQGQKKPHSNKHLYDVPDGVGDLLFGSED